MSTVRYNRRGRIIVLICMLTTTILLFLYHWSLPAPIPDPTYGALENISSSSKYAIATFLTGDNDEYFVSTRVLTYQIVHANETRCTRAIPFLVVATSTLSQDKRDQLTKDGAQVVVVEDVPIQWWVRTSVSRWKDQFTKLRIFEMVEYDRILFIDADSLLTRPVDGIFDENIIHRPTPANFFRTSEIRRDEAPVPAQYVFAARSDNAPYGEGAHPFPPVEIEKFIAGFWLAAPSKELFRYLMSVMEHWRRFNPKEMEQSLLNYAFRRKGPMPWREVDYRWSANWPNEKDLEGGVTVLHEKLWKQGHPDLMKLWTRWKERMEAHYDGE
jgi:alpha-N-acetylglucosamine transferase